MRVGQGSPGRLGIRKKLASSKWQFSFCLPQQSFACFCLLARMLPPSAVAGARPWSVSRSAAPQIPSTRSPRALERAGGQQQACGSCAQLLLRCERLQLAMRPPKLPDFLAAAPVVHLHGHSPENETGARLQVGSAVARLPLQRRSPAPSGCCMANVVAPDFATATTFICMVSSPDVAALNLFASALLDFDFVLLLLAAS